MMKWRFRRNWRGKQILQKRIKGFLEFPDMWMDATDDDGINFTLEIKMLMEKIEIIKEMKNKHPEIFLV